MKKFKTGDIVYIKATNLCNIEPHKVDAFLYNDNFEEEYSENPGDGNVYVLENMVSVLPKICALQSGMDYWENIGRDVITANHDRLLKLHKIYRELKEHKGAICGDFLER